MSSDEFVVTPWHVEGDIDYDKLIKQFGTQKISNDLLSKLQKITGEDHFMLRSCLLYTSPSPRDPKTSRMPSSA